MRYRRLAVLRRESGGRIGWSEEPRGASHCGNRYQRGTGFPAREGQLSDLTLER
jgi:hypothetical protein